MNLAMRGPCCNTGYGNVFRSLALRLGRHMNVQVLALNNHVTADCSLDICPRQTFRDLGLLVGYPPDIHQLCTRYRILYAMAEVSDIHDDWKPELAHTHEVWVPTTFCAQVFREYHPRVKVVPVGYEETLYNSAVYKRMLPEERERFWFETCPEAVGKFVFGSAGVMSPRKGVDVLIRAWELAGLDDAVLLIKTRETRGTIGEARNVYVIDANWPNERLADFYRALDVFVLPTRGEGLGLQPLEAAACGTPALVTRASGPADYIDDRGIYGIEVAGTSGVTTMSAHHARWFEPDIVDCVDKLRAFREQRPGVEHQYRHWSMGGLIERWVSELESAERRSRGHVAN